MCIGRLELVDRRKWPLTSIVGGAEPEPVGPVLHQLGNFVGNSRAVVDGLESERGINCSLDKQIGLLSDEYHMQKWDDKPMRQVVSPDSQQFFHK